MRLDVVTIFPDYMAPLHLSLVGKAIASGLVDLTVHDLRTWAYDRHHTTDDTPYGGGAGMVMKPEPWGEALDALTEMDSAPMTIIVPTPAGQPFTQELAYELATKQRLVFACGRYEGIDQRVLDHCDAEFELMEVSLGDYVLNGGEVAVLAMVEAVVRLIPGVIGNPDSLREESHSLGQDSLLEYPNYTKPPVWRGRAVPEILLSGNHGLIAAWRRQQSMERTAQRRPDLTH
ncbi:MAG: tRNA (guanosine(37)-N1)-methyltransferase TrmD [Arachnia sp.]